ncbi:MAG: 3-hydroxyacyl-CoA dehydrogenase NAD-binding domain-containing protein [Alphaproteobacteria bacterium]
MANIETVGIVGAGTIGSSWATYFLAQGLNVRCWDPMDGYAARVSEFVARAWHLMEELGLAEGASLDRLYCFDRIEDALDGVEFVQESGPEDADLKAHLMAEIDRGLPPDVVISSSTTALPVSEFQHLAAHPERIVLGHPFNPPHLMPVVEVGGGKLTGSEAVDRAMEFYEAIGKTPIRLRAEIPGHLVNRLQGALYREAVYLVAEGYATVEDIDKAVTGGPGLRWAFMGPHMTYHLGGGDGGIARYLEILGPSQERRWAALGDPKLTEEVKQKIVEGVNAETHGRPIGDLAVERDATLMELLKLLRR